MNQPGVYTKKGRNSQQRRFRYTTLRFIILFCAFLIIAINPCINYYLHNSFVQGWYQSFGIGSLWFVSPLEGLESLLITKTVYMPSIIGMVLPLLLVLLLGRVFCSWICPVTFILEITDRLRRAVSRKKYLRNRLIVVKKVLWFTLLAEILISMIIGAPLFVFLSPPGLVGREMMMLVFFHTLAIEGVLLLVIITLELVTRRFFCRSFCPLGALLALLGSKRKLLVVVESTQCVDCGACEQTCPMGLVPQMGEGITAYCWNCGECLDSCRTGALRFSWNTKYQ
ncbi:4Fe-4S binding protein [Desulfogranum japonicum]|uniref:4Fe-4S binding protein n=1 Tax=Desulfogranum japonicum TaxID=231447 RepID=UPI000A01E396|nr:4Fe-4S binding protein [Desulfogranum japonicum]